MRFRIPKEGEKRSKYIFAWFPIKNPRTNEWIWWERIEVLQIYYDTKGWVTKDTS